MQIVGVAELGGIQASGLMDLRGSLLWLWSSRRGALILAAVAAVSSLVTIRSTTKLVLLLVILRLYRIRGRPINVNVTPVPPAPPPPPPPIYYYDYSDDDNDSEDIDDGDSEEELLTSSPCSEKAAAAEEEEEKEDEKEDEDENRADGDWVQGNDTIGVSHLLWGSQSEMAAGGVVKSWVDNDAIHVRKGFGLLLRHDDDDACNCSTMPALVADLINPDHLLLLTASTRADTSTALALASVPIVSAAAENGGSTLSVRVWDPRSKGHSVRRMVGAVTASSSADGVSKAYLHDELRLVCVVDLRSLRSPLCSHFVGYDE